MTSASDRFVRLANERIESGKDNYDFSTSPMIGMKAIFGVSTPSAEFLHRTVAINRVGMKPIERLHALYQRKKIALKFVSNKASRAQTVHCKVHVRNR